MISKREIGTRIVEARLATGIRSTNELARRVEALRKQQGLKGKRAAVLSRQAVANWEKGLIVPPLEKLELLCQVFGADFDEAYIMFGIRAGTTLAEMKNLLIRCSQEEGALLNMYRHTTQSGQKTILEIVGSIAEKHTRPAAELVEMTKTKR